MKKQLIIGSDFDINYFNIKKITSDVLKFTEQQNNKNRDSSLKY